MHLKVQVTSEINQMRRKNDFNWECCVKRTHFVVPLHLHGCTQAASSSSSSVAKQTQQYRFSSMTPLCLKFGTAGLFNTAVVCSCCCSCECSWLCLGSSECCWRCWRIVSTSESLIDPPSDCRYDSLFILLCTCNNFLFFSLDVVRLGSPADLEHSEFHLTFFCLRVFWRWTFQLDSFTSRNYLSTSAHSVSFLFCQLLSLLISQGQEFTSSCN